jgi:RNA polymerase sigma-70 factor (ECF subfamily)
MPERAPGRKEEGSERENCWEEYVKEIQGRNADALKRLYDASSPMLYRLVYRILGNAADAEEVLIDTFEQVWRTAGTFNPVRGDVRRWLVLLTRSRALDRLRSMAGKRLREHPVIFERDVISKDPHPEEVSMLGQQQYRVRQALARLPQEQRQAVELAYFFGLTHTEIASTLGVPLGTIKTRIRSAMDRLRLAFASVAAGDSTK